MAIFAIIADGANAALDVKVESLFQPADRYRVSSNVWVVSAQKIAQVIADELGVSGGGLGRVVVFGVSSHFGWHDKALWEWMALKGSK